VIALLNATNDVMKSDGTRLQASMIVVVFPLPANAFNTIDNGLYSTASNASF
jgi:hypothetical protein